MPVTPEGLRSYLLVLAGIHLDGALRGKVSPSDIVQQTLIEAHQKIGEFRGSGPELAAWLRQILRHNLLDAQRTFGRAKRDAGREQRLETGLEESSQRLANLLPADGPSPSRQAGAREDVLRLADALNGLPPAQRDAVVLHHLEGLPLSETAARMDRSESAVAGLLHRGLAKLREHLEGTD